jgi:hypothetical protein
MPASFIRIGLSSTLRSLSESCHSTAAHDLQQSASFSARKNSHRIPANTLPVFSSLRPRIHQRSFASRRGLLGQTPSARGSEIEKIDAEGQTQPRIAFTTYGNHGGTNKYRYCSTGILAGVHLSLGSRPVKLFRERCRCSLSGIGTGLEQVGVLSSARISTALKTKPQRKADRRWWGVRHGVYLRDRVTPPYLAT